jgi:hypothetical protein
MSASETIGILREEGVRAYAKSINSFSKSRDRRCPYEFDSTLLSRPTVFMDDATARPFGRKCRRTPMEMPEPPIVCLTGAEPPAPPRLRYRL